MPFSTSASAPPTPLWQHPFVEVVRYALAHQSVGWQQHGDVDQVTDPQIHKNVFKIRGAIASANYVRFPREVSQSCQGLGLTGRYVYIQLRRAKGQHATLHLDLLTSKKTALRYSLSSMYPSLRSSGTVLRVPLVLSERWTTVVVDMTELLQFHGFNGYSREKYRHLKAVTVCASVNLRNVFTASKCFTSETIPATLAIPSMSEKQSGPFEWLSLPTSLGLVNPLPKASAGRVPGTKDGSRVCQFEGFDAGENDSDDSDEVAAVQPIDSPPHFLAGSPAQEFDSTGSCHRPHSPASRNIGLIRDREDVLSRADQIMRNAGFPVPSPRRRSGTLKRSGVEDSSSLFSPRRYLASEQSDWPDPILILSRIIGFSTAFPKSLRWLPDAPACVYASHSTIVLREFTSEGGARLKNDLPLILKTDNQEGTSRSTVASANSTNGGILTDDRESFLVGHTGEICALEVSRDGALLASAQNTPQCVLRIWDLRDGQGQCLVVINSPTKSVHALTFAKDSTSICCVGSDDHARTQIFVWDCSNLLASTTATSGSKVLVLRARQTCDFHICAIAFSAYESNQLVSCGKENIRFWRINSARSHLSGSPVILKEYSRGTVFTDLAFDAVYPHFPSNLPRLRPLFVSSSVGTMLVVNYDSRDIVCVYKLHDAAIHSICVNEGFCVTGSEDKFLRVWPLDFSDFFLEAEHEASVKNVDVSSDGMRVSVSTSSGAIGILHLADQRYRTILRSHSGSINALAPLAGGSLVTSACDGTLRVWNSATGAQTIEFDVSRDVVTCVSAMPTADKSPVTIAVGFQSGSSRIFSLGDEQVWKDGASSFGSRVLFEFQQHQSPLCDIQYQSDAKTLYTLAAGQQLCLHDVGQDYAPIKLLIADVDTMHGKMCLSRDGRFLAVLQQGRRSILLLDALSLCVVHEFKPAAPNHSSMADRNGGGGELTHIAISWNSQELITVSRADRAYVFSLSEDRVKTASFGAVLHSMPLLGQHGIASIALSPNLKYIATGGSDGSVRVWQCEFGKHKFQRMHQTFLLHAGDGYVRGLAFSDDGAHIFAVSDGLPAVFVWRFRGNTSKLPVLHLDANFRKPSTRGREVAEPSRAVENRAGFELLLDRIHHEHDPAADQHGRVASRDELSPKPAESVTLARSPRTLYFAWKRIIPALSLSSSNCFAWASPLGCVVYSAGDGCVVVVEKIESGEQHFMRFSDATEQIVVSPSRDRMVIVHKSKDAVTVCDLRELRRDNQEDDSEEGQVPITTSKVELPMQLSSVHAIEFSTDNSLLCVSGESPGGSQLFIVDVASKGRAAWHVELPGSSAVSCLFSQSAREFLCVVPNESTPLQRVRVPPFSLLTVALSLEASLDASLPSRPHLFSFRDDGPRSQLQTGRCRFAVAVDDTSYAYFLDLDQQRLVHVMQLLLPSLGSTIRCIEWAGTSDWQGLIITLSTNAIAVFALPTRFGFTSLNSRVAAIDWPQLRRTSRLTCLHVLSFQEERISRVVTDLCSDTGVVVTANGAVIVVNFHSQQRLVLRAAPSLDLTSDEALCATLALDGLVLLTLTHDRQAIRCWEPRIGRELAQFLVPSTLCSCFSVSPFDSRHVVAGYDDGSVRIFDVCGQRLVLQCSLPALQRNRPSSGGKQGTPASPAAQYLTVLKQKERKSKPSAFVGSKGSPSIGTAVRGLQEVHFIGRSSILAVTKPFRSGKGKSSHRLLVLDASDVLESCGHASKGATAAKRNDSVVHYREITLPSPDQLGVFRSSPSTASCQDWDVKIEAVDVQPSHASKTTSKWGGKTPTRDEIAAVVTKAFLIVVRMTSRRHKSIRVALVYSGSNCAASHPVHKEDEVVPCDYWLLDSSAAPSVLFHPSEAGQVVYLVKGASVRQIEMRDFLARTPVLRLEIPEETSPVELGTLARWRVRGKFVLTITDTSTQHNVVVDLATRTVNVLRNLQDSGAASLIATEGGPILLLAPGRGLFLTETTFSKISPPAQ